jgi:hypothetical protein
MLAKVTTVLAPVVFLAVAATPAPDELAFIKSACLGAIAGASARVAVALFAESVGRVALGVYLAFGSFWLGVIGALLAYLFGVITGYDQIHVAAAAAGVSLFGIVLEMLAQKYLKARARALSRQLDATTEDRGADNKNRS